MGAGQRFTAPDSENSGVLPSLPPQSEPCFQSIPQGRSSGSAPARSPRGAVWESLRLVGGLPQAAGSGSRSLWSRGMSVRLARVINVGPRRAHLVSSGGLAAQRDLGCPWGLSVSLCSSLPVSSPALPPARRILPSLEVPSS